MLHIPQWSEKFDNKKTFTKNDAFKRATKLLRKRWSVRMKKHEWRNMLFINIKMR